jgi:predicted amidohydrolase
MTRIAVVEVRDAPPDTAANARAGLATIGAAADAGAALVLFPELFLGGYYLDHAMVARTAGAAAALARVQAAVDETGVAVVLGAALQGTRGPAGGAESPLMPAGGSSPGAAPSGDLLLNAVPVLRPRLPAAYAIKTHLYHGEEQWFTAGGALWNDRVAGWPCGIAICYEVGFPEVARCLALGGAQLILLPAAFGRARARLWDTLTRARAAENGCYLAAAGQAGSAGDREFLGHSRIVDPFGEIVAGVDDAGPTGQAIAIGAHTLIVAEIDAGKVEAARRGDDGWHRTLADRRPRLYGALTEE